MAVAVALSVVGIGLVATALVPTALTALQAGNAGTTALAMIRNVVGAVATDSDLMVVTSSDRIVSNDSDVVVSIDSDGARGGGGLDCNSAFGSGDGGGGSGSSRSGDKQRQWKCIRSIIRKRQNGGDSGPWQGEGGAKRKVAMPVRTAEDTAEVLKQAEKRRGTIPSEVDGAWAMAEPGVVKTLAVEWGQAMMVGRSGMAWRLAAKCAARVVWQVHMAGWRSLLPHHI